MGSILNIQVYKYASSIYQLFVIGQKGVIMEKRRFKRLSDVEFDVILEGNKMVQGDISCEGNLKVGCPFKGGIQTDGIVFITRKGEVQADIKCFAMIISGKVKGNTVIANKIEVRRAGVLSGNVRCDMLAMEEDSFVTESVESTRGDKSFTKMFVFKERRKELLDESEE